MSRTDFSEMCLWSALVTGVCDGRSCVGFLWQFFEVVKYLGTGRWGERGDAASQSAMAIYHSLVAVIEDAP